MMSQRVRILFWCLVFFTPLLHAQGLINNEAVIIINNGAHIYIDGDANGGFTNEGAFTPGEVHTLTSGTITLEGDWTENAGQMALDASPDPSTVIFNGATAQSIKGTTGAAIFHNLVLNNSSGIATGVTLNIPTSVITSLTLTNGVLNSTSTNYLAMLNASTTTTGNSGSYVDGPMRYYMALSGTRSLNLPLGKSSDWRPAVLTPTHSAATSYYYTAELFNADAQALGFTKPPTITHVSYVHYYTITRNSAANFSNATLRIYYSNTDGFNDGVTDAANLGVAKDDGSGNWVDITSGGGSANNVGNILSASYSPQNTYFTLANKSGGTNPLPVELLNFNGICKGDSVLLKWNTANETNNSHFTVERSTDGINFESIATVPGAGNSSTISNYELTDYKFPTLNSPTLYYRLKQTDFDGTTKTYFPISISCVENQSSNAFTVFPNPNKGNFSVLISGMENETLLVSIYDVIGREIFSKEINVSNDSFLFDVNLSTSTPNGTYMLSIKTNQQLINQKVVIQ